MSTKRRLFESQTIDMATGEVKSITTITVSKANERFAMYRTTNGLEWIKTFTGKEMQMMMLLNHLENMQTRTVNLSPMIRQEIQEFFNIGKSTLAGMIAAMEDKGFLVRLTKSDLLLNPSFFYKGESKDLLKRIQSFNVEYDKIRKENSQTTDNQSKKEENTEESKDTDQTPL